MVWSHALGRIASDLCVHLYIPFRMPERAIADPSVPNDKARQTHQTMKKQKIYSSNHPVQPSYCKPYLRDSKYWSDVLKAMHFDAPAPLGPKTYVHPCNKVGNEFPHSQDHGISQKYAKRDMKREKNILFFSLSHLNTYPVN